MAELRPGLMDAADAYASAGLAPAAAARAAISEFGDPGLIAEAFRAEIASRQARRVAVTLLVTGRLVGLLWAGTAAASHLAARPGPLWPWTGLSPAPAPGGRRGRDHGLRGAGRDRRDRRLTRWLPARPRRAPAAAAVAGFGAMGADGLGLVLLAGWLATAPGGLSPVLAAAAAAASLARLLLAGRAARRCLAAAASLT